VILLVGAGSLAIPSWASGVELDDLEVHAFLSQGAMKSTDNNYLTKSSLGSFDFTEAGINFTRQLMDDLRAGFQLFARRPTATGGFNARFDWFYLDYHWSDYLGFRFGRVKLPFGLYNESSDVDAARVPILLPQSVYPVTSRDYLLALSGFQFYGHVRSASLGALNYRVYGGTISADIVNTPGSPVQVSDLNVPYVTGGRLLWDTPVDGLRVGGTVQALRLDTTVSVGTTSPLTMSAQTSAVLWVASSEFARGNFLLAAEYGRWHLSSGNNTNQALFDALVKKPSVTNERAYVLSTYRLTDWLQPGLYYSIFFPDVDNRGGPGNQQHDLSATLRFDINRFWIVKAEGHYMRGSAGLSSALNGGAPLSSLAQSWGMFLVKTTAYF
jgi:hypothetical protein